MGYFTHDFLDFFAELKENNNREWFNENKKRFEKSVKKPFYTFTDEMILRINGFDPDILVTAKDCIFRIYRDTRFSNNKTPYKEHLGAVIAPGGRKPVTRPGFYYQFSNDQIQIHCGNYMIEKPALSKLRYHIANKPENFREVIESPSFLEFYGKVNGEKNKRLPADLTEAAEKEPLIYNKEMYASAYLNAESILSDDLPDLILAHYLAAKEFIDYLNEATKE